MKNPLPISCNICPRNCGVNRYLETGFCGAGTELMLNLAALHHGEEPPLSGKHGSGTIFLSWCNLRCVYCQNYNISTKGWGKVISSEELIGLMLELQAQGAHNINFVTPTHYSPQLKELIPEAKQRGLVIPIVWNSSAYESVQTLQGFSGLVNIYLADYKYAHGVYAKKYSHASDYSTIALAAIKEMFAQVGHLQVDADGIAQRGLIIRLLVLPNSLSGTKASLHKIVDMLGSETYISLMGQYYPAGVAENYPELNRGITEQEYDSILEAAISLGFNNIFTQELSCSNDWTPEFVENLQANNSPAIAMVNPCGSEIR